ncbi:AMP-binding protein [Streptomyces sp. NPDC005876]|uniref:AMP-binding protein n=1 Tax=Streptomyces sp. NPDC005876 TaxID=3157076 RepID=UPI0033D9699C
MTITETSAPAVATEQDPIELGPFQRSSLSAGERRLNLRVRVPAASATALRDALTSAVAAAPVLTADRVPMAGLRVPRQRSSGAGSWHTSEAGTLHMTAGTLSVTIENSWDGPLLTVSCDTLFADTRSLTLLLAEIDRNLDGSNSAREPRLDFLSVAQEHCAMLRDGELQDEENYWAVRRRPAGTGGPSLTDAVPGGEADTGEGAVSVARTLPRDQVERLLALAADVGCAAEDIAYLSLDTVVRRLGLAPQDLGLRCDARDLMGLPDLIGPLTQTVPAGWKLDLTESAATALSGRCQERQDAADMLGGPALSADSPRPALVFEQAGVPEMPKGWYLDSWSYPVDGEAAFSLRISGSTWRLHVECVGEIGRARARALLSLWSGLLEDLVSRPAEPLGSLRLLPLDEAESVARGLVSRRRASSTRRLVDTLLDRVRETPTALACRQGDRVWTYRQLGVRVAALCAALPAMEDGSVVAILAEHEFDMLAAEMAALWRGAAFLPLSPQEPAARLTDALEKARAAVVLTGAGAPTVPLPAGCGAIAMADVADDDSAVLGEPAGVEDAAPAYLLRTSGSTGVPKLIAISRHSLDNYLTWASDVLLDDHAQMPVLSSPVFDASLKQTLGVLHRGGCVWLLTADRLDLSAVRAELAAEHRPIAVNCVPSYISALLDDIGTADSPVASETTTLHISRFLLGGEALDEELTRRIWQRFPKADIWNLYGPTETTATATAGRIEPGAGIHVGRPVAGARLVIVDTSGEVLPPGVLGEVVITGPGLANGYLNGHEGASPFVDLSVGGTVCAAYRTGDLGYLDDAGALRIAGRRDSQIKLNGWRIDLREIERAAQRADGVRDSVVMLDRSGAEPSLRAFITGTAEADAVFTELRATLPGPMIPASITVLPQFPTTVTGKVDRQALLDAVTSFPEASPDDYDPEELLVATKWRELLGHGWPRPDDEFFAAGGHSLLLARLVNVLRAQGHNHLSLRQVVRRPTVASVAALIRAGSGSD